MNDDPYSEMQMPKAHLAVEHLDIESLADQLDKGADPNEFFNGWTLLHHAIDVEVQLAGQDNSMPHVDMTALLLAKGADPNLPDMSGISSRHFAFTSRHFLATQLIESWLRRDVA